MLTGCVGSLTISFFSSTAILLNCLYNQCKIEEQSETQRHKVATQSKMEADMAARDIAGGGFVYYIVYGYLSQ